MPSAKLDTLWDAQPHTIAKITMLEGYLLAWFQIMGRTKTNQDLIYVDGFAGPGKYKNYSKGSPIAALTAAKEAIALTGPNWKAGDIHCAFIEPEKKRFEHLQQVLNPFQGSTKLKIHLLNTFFTEGLTNLAVEHPLLFRSANPRFVFVDPFGAKGVPFSTVRDILSNSCAEILINLDADGIARIFEAREAANYVELLNRIFGDDSWKSVLLETLPFTHLCDAVLNLYKSKLRSLPNVRYVFAFEMRARSNTLNYYLVFASQHYLGLEKMKEAMKRLDQSGSYCFSDANVHQEHLFRFNDPSMHSTQLHHAFRGRAIPYTELRDFALNETPFVNPKSMLKDLEEKHLIEVTTADAKRRRGTFNENKIKLIKFT